MLIDMVASVDPCQPEAKCFNQGSQFAESDIL